MMDGYSKGLSAALRNMLMFRKEFVARLEQNQVPKEPNKGTVTGSKPRVCIGGPMHGKVIDVEWKLYASYVPCFSIKTEDMISAEYLPRTLFIGDIPVKDVLVERSIVDKSMLLMACFK